MSNTQIIPKVYENTTRSTLFKVKKNQIQMMIDRGYDVGDEAYLMDYDIGSFISAYEQSAVDNNTTFRAMLGNMYERETSDPIDNHVYVMFLETPTETGQIGKPQITQVIDYVRSLEGITHIMLITEVGLSPDAKNTFAKLPLYNVEHFLYEEMAYNPTKHYLVPKHRIMTAEESRAFLHGWPDSTPESMDPASREANRPRRLLDLGKLPWISMEDPISRYYGGRPGHIMQISRNDLSGQTMVTETISYRAVVDRPLSKVKITAKTKPK